MSFQRDLQNSDSSDKQQWRTSHSARYNHQIASDNSALQWLVAEVEAFTAKNGLDNVQYE